MRRSVACAVGGWLAALSVSVLVSGCAATGPKGAEMTAALNAIPAGYGRIVFYRSSSVVGAAVQPDIRLDGQVVGQSRPGGFFYVDAAPGRHTASASTEATSTAEVSVVAGQTSYVRSAIGMGFVVGRVALSVEGTVTAKGELVSLSYTGTQVARIGIPTDAAAASGPAAAGRMPTAAGADARLPALRRGDEIVYRVVDGYTGIARDAVLTVDRVEAERIVFDRGARVERPDGAVVSISTPLVGDMDLCSPPGGWGPPPDMTLGMRWNVRFHKPGGEAQCGGDFDLEAQLVSDERVSTALGDLRAQRIDYKGSGSRPGATLALEARVWYAPVLVRVVRFESETITRTGRNAAPSREKVELIEIRRP